MQGDFDGDGKTIFGPRDTATRKPFFFSESAAATKRILGISSDLILPGDYDGDGKRLAVARGRTGKSLDVLGEIIPTSFISVSRGDVENDFRRGRFPATENRLAVCVRTLLRSKRTLRQKVLERHFERRSMGQRHYPVAT